MIAYKILYFVFIGNFEQIFDKKGSLAAYLA